MKIIQRASGAQKLFFQQFFSKGILRKTFIRLLAVFFSVSVFFLILIYNISIRDMRTNVYETSIHVLEKTISLSDQIMITLSKNIDRLANDPIIVNTVVNPDISQTERNFKTINLLDNFRKNELYVSQVALFTSYNQQIYEPNGIIPVSQSSRWNDLLTIKADSTTSQYDIEIIIHESGTYLRKGFLDGFDGKLGYLLVMLNTQDIYRSIYGDLKNLYITTPNQKAFIPDSFSPTAEVEDIISQHNPSNTIFAVSDFSNLYFYYYYPDTVFKITDFSGQFSPYWLAVLIPVLIFIALLIAWSYYKPIRSIIHNSNLNALEPVQAHQNEWELLDHAISYIRDENIYFKDIITIASPDIMRRLLVDLLDGRELPEREIRMTLSGINTTLNPDKYFIIFLLTDSITGVIETNRQNKCIDKLNALQTKEFTVFPFVYRYSIIALIQLDALSDQRENDFLEDIWRALKICSRTISNIQICSSDPFCPLFSIREEYLNIYNNAGHSHKNTVQPTEQLSFKDIIKATIYDIPNHDPDTTEHMIDGIIARLLNDGDPEDYRIRNIEYLAEEVNKLAVKYHIEIRQWDDIICRSKTKNTSELLQLAGDYAKEIADQIHSTLKKRQNKHLLEATQYLKTNYSDGSLSLNTVSEQIGINASYLSKLFNDAYNKGFSQYLNEIRIEHAKSLLLNNNVLIRDICDKTGFLSVQNFTRVFKKHTGCTPGEYRKNTLL